MLKIGEKIKELRKSQDVTQEKLADYLNISYQAVSKWENNLALPDLSLIPALCNFFGVTSDYLLGIKADENEEKINEYFEKSMNCSHTGEMEKGIEIIREALKHTPIIPSFCLCLSVSFLALFVQTAKKNFWRK